VLLPGNHDDNLLALGRVPRKLRGACDWRRRHYDEAGTLINSEIVQHWRLGCEYRHCRRRGVYRVGQVTFSHGYEHGVSADEFHTLLLGQPYGLYVGAHTHQPHPVTQAMRTRTVPLPYWYVNAGCLRNLKPPYVHRQRTHNWGHAMVIGEVLQTKSPRMSRQWWAELRVKSMYDDWAGAN